MKHTMFLAHALATPWAMQREVLAAYAGVQRQPTKVDTSLANTVVPAPASVGTDSCVLAPDGQKLRRIEIRHVQRALKAPLRPKMREVLREEPDELEHLSQH